ncbi:MAG: type II secretion system protein [Candidatus Microgenomates bacterium]|jgi:prepilin-type N-terminal cleavage/methylation domain-containing protein
MTAQRKGFTLIELLLVIAIIGILAAVVAAAINPAQKMKQAGDSKVRSDIGQIAGALQSYYTRLGYYPAAISDLVGTTSELVAAPLPPANPTGYGAAYTLSAKQSDGSTACTTAAGNCARVALSGTILAGNPTTNTMFCWSSQTGTAADASACTP